jgi:hypothetical protein
MNKKHWFLLFFYFFATISLAQDSIADKIENIKYTNEDFEISQEDKKKFEAIQSSEKERNLFFEKDFKEKYNEPIFEYRRKTESKNLTEWEKFKRKVNDFFSNLFNFQKLNGQFTAVEWVMKILIYLIIAVAIYFIIRVLIRKENSWVFSRAPKNISYSFKEDENIHQIRFQDKITFERRNKNYRLCIRYYYLWLLKVLNDNKTIVFDIEKTNTDYLNEIKDSQLKQKFSYLSYIYNYCWYGEFDITEEDFYKVEKLFKEVLN